MFVNSYAFGSGAVPFQVVDSISGSGDGGAGGGSNHVVPMPTGLQAGHLILVLLSVDGNSVSLTIDTAYSGSNWNALTQVNGSGFSMSHRVYWKIAEGGDQLRITSGVVEQVSTITYAISGANGVTSTGSSASGSQGDPPNHTPPGGSAEYIWIGFCSYNTGVTVTAGPTNYNDLIFNNRAGAPSASAWRKLTAASENPGSFTASPTTGVCASTISVSKTP